ncbi:XRE family transcriptional regulator [Streptomyces piniterrae]|uniref:XRE family transcriptional regulator n=1 Tax=Streptomyces piniterrae TaxID=2571125 RepID=A0A4U0NS43_9ACTN|nr:XRE family transcriptional regulator [Streptomyces piniterrae]TJZ57419.1 XRE family transcriptional regulator [Streptomyces piniterrae]
MSDIDDALERADHEAFTREPPKSTQKRVEFLLHQLKTTRAVADLLSVSQRSVERYLKAQRKTPPKAIADRIETEVRRRWQPRVRQRRRRQAATSTGLTVETRARFGYTAPIGTTDDPRQRRLTVHLPPEYADRLFQAQQQGANEQRLREIIAEGLQEMYFKDGGRRAQGLDVEITDIDYLDISYAP